MRVPISTKLLGFDFEVTWSACLILAIIVIQSAGDGSDVGLLLEGLVWCGVIFGSILVHELGHAVVGRFLGLKPVRIVLHGLGGLTQYQITPTPRQGIVAAVAGPFAGILLGVAAGAMTLFVPESMAETRQVLVLLFALNIFWSLFNLLPMLPLDGGFVVLHGIALAKGLAPAIQWTRRVSIATGVLVGLLGLLAQMPFVFILAAFVVVQNFRR